MKIIMKKNEIEKVNVLVKKILDKVVSEIGVSIPAGLDGMDMMLEVFGNEGTIDGPTAVITTTADEIIIEIKEEFLNDYLTLLDEISSDVIEFVTEHKAILWFVFTSLKTFFIGTIITTVKQILEPVKEPAKGLWGKLEKRFMDFAEKFMQ